MGREYANGPFQLTSGSSVVISVESVDFPTNAEVSDNGSGSLYAEGQALTGFAPVATITSKAIDQVFNSISLGGTCFGSGLTITAATQFLRNLTKCQSGAASNESLAATEGLLRLGQLSAARGEDATIQFIVDTLTDGTNAPVAKATGVTLPTTVVATRFTLGLVTVAGVDYDEIDNVDLAFVVESTVKRPRLGQIWPESTGVLTVRPVLTLTGRDASKITNALLAAGSEVATHANTTIRLKKRAAGAGAFVADATAEHITLTLAGAHVPQNIDSGSGPAAITNTTTLLADNDGTNAPVVIDTAAQYSES